MDITLKEFISAAALVFAFWKYTDIRKRELRWKRTEFLFKQAEFLDSDLVIALAVSVLDDKDDEVKIGDLFDENGNIDNTIDKKYRIGFEKLCNFLDRIAYAYLNTKAIEKKEIANFSWYIEHIVNSSRIVKYCENNGFGDIIKLSKAY